MRSTGAARGAGAAVVALAVAACVGVDRAERRWTVMGTYATAEVYAVTKGAAEETVEDVRSTFERVDALMSNWRDDSALSRLNREARDSPFVVDDPDLFRCIKLAREYAKRSDGAFDPTVGPLMQIYGFRPPPPRVPSDEEVRRTLESVGWEKLEVFPETRAVRFLVAGMEIDLGGIGKGYAVDMAARLFARPGIRSGMLDLGGTLYAWGSPRGVSGGEWRVGIRDPEAPDSVMATVPLTYRAASTSGTYENSVRIGDRRIGHIMDPRTGRPAESDVVSATVLADSGVEADADSTAFLVAGSQRTATMLQGAKRIEAILVVRTGVGLSVLASTSLRDRVEFEPRFLERVGGRIRFILPPREL